MAPLSSALEALTRAAREVPGGQFRDAEEGELVALLASLKRMGWFLSPQDVVAQLQQTNATLVEELERMERAVDAFRESERRSHLASPSDISR